MILAGDPCVLGAFLDLIGSSGSASNHQSGNISSSGSSSSYVEEVGCGAGCKGAASSPRPGAVAAVLFVALEGHGSPAHMAPGNATNPGFGHRLKQPEIVASG